jgi:sulfite reductase (ferredoxin)
MSTVMRLPAGFDEDLARFREEIERFQQGAVPAAEFRAFRVPRGVYEQREEGTYMLRARCPAGVLLPAQLRALARVSRNYGSGTLHVTTRQDIQVHRVLLPNVYSALAELHAAGLSTKGGGGNTVRNITACCDTGVCPQEAFDVSPSVVALSEFLLPDPLSYQLPRKYKIAFSACSRDCAGATINDLGFIAKRRDGVDGFAVYLAGGMGAESRTGTLFETFVPAHEIHLVAEAVKRVFDQHGNRRDRHKARIRFLLERVGLDQFRQWYRQELAAIRPSAKDLAIRPLPNPPDRTAVAAAQPAPGFDEWRTRSVEPQKQAGSWLVHIPLPLGEISADTLEQLADVVQQHGEGCVRTTQRQGLVLRWVRSAELAALHAGLAHLGLASVEPPILQNLVSCTGASTCRLGICLSRGLTTAIRSALAASTLDLAALGELRIHVSGCPNSCGRHPIADIGLFGVARRVGERLVPHYVLQLGGKVAEGETRLATGDQAIPARNVPALLVALLDAYRRSADFPDFAAFLQNSGRQLAEDLAEQYKAVPDFSAGREYYVDWGGSDVFSLAGRGPGECGAGVFDLIEVDLQSAQEAIRAGKPFEATILAARALLVTRGHLAENAQDALDLFTRLFLGEALVDRSYGDLISLARQAAQRQPEGAGFQPEAGTVERFVDTIARLYGQMDSSLRFKPVTETRAVAPAAAAPVPPPIDRQADFRGVVCPLNYVRTKMVLDRMKAGEVLSVLLDREGARNVPPSVANDGHEVIDVRPEGEDWRITVRKA